MRDIGFPPALIAFGGAVVGGSIIAGAPLLHSWHWLWGVFIGCWIGGLGVDLTVKQYHSAIRWAEEDVYRSLERQKPTLTDRTGAGDL